MKARRLVSWPRWRQQRVAELHSEGLNIATALEVAKVETNTRQRLGRVIGWRAARAAELNVIADGDSVRFALTGGLAGLSAEQRDRLLQLPNLSPMITPDTFAGSVRP